VTREPVLVILNGLAVVVGLVLVALNTLNVTHLEPGAVTAVVAAVAGSCNLLGFAIRAGVTPVAVAGAQVAQALATPTPGQQAQLDQALNTLPPAVTAAIDAHLTRQAAGA